MGRHIVVIALAALVILSAAAHADAETAKAAHAKKSGHVSMGTIVITKHYDKSSPS
jgi:type VI protein secretion system component Hcp